jgi:hypothetical protein
MITICHSRILSSSTNPALNPSTGFFCNSAHTRQPDLATATGHEGTHRGAVS